MFYCQIETETASCEIADAMKLAAERYSEDARICRESGHARLAAQFEKQANRARRLAEQFGNAFDNEARDPVHICF